MGRTRFMMRKWGFFTAVLLGTFVVSLPSHSAELTDVIDAADGDDPFDMRADVEFRRTLRRAKITREFACPAGEFANEPVDPCPNAPQYGKLLHVKELRFERVVQELVPKLRFGLWHDLELFIEAPIVLSNEQEIRFAGNGGDRAGTVITPENSTIAPGQGAHLFDVPPAGLPTRAGFGDMLFMVRYSPISQERDAQRGTWTLEVGYRAPTGDAMKPGSKGVGRGVHELILSTGLSHRFTYVEPYVRFRYTKPFAAKGSLFKNYGDQESYGAPGHNVRFDLGAEFIPYFDKENGAKLYVDFGFSGAYQAKGRDYSELFDALGLAGRGCPNGFSTAEQNVDDRGLPNVACFNPDSSSEVRGLPHDGITTVDPFVTIQMNLGGGIYVSEHAKLGGYLSIAHDTEHFLSNASVGSDADNTGFVESRGQANFNADEHNPTYVPSLDRLGRRIRVEETTVFTFGVSLALML